MFIIIFLACKSIRVLIFKDKIPFLKQSVKASKQTEIKNEIFIDNKKITLKNQEVQNACGLKSENDKIMFFKSLTDYSNKLIKNILHLTKFLFIFPHLQLYITIMLLYQKIIY